MILAQESLRHYSVCPGCQMTANIDRRNLCRDCYRDPIVRAAHPVVTTYRTGVADFNGRGKQPTPTNTTPGSPEKLAVLCARAEAGESLFHPLDYSGGDS